MVENMKNKQGKNVLKYKKNEWNLALLYSSIKDPKIEKDVADLETMCDVFSGKYHDADNSFTNSFTNNDEVLLESLKEYEAFKAKASSRPFMFLTFAIHLNGEDIKAQSLLNLLISRITKASNKIIFYSIALGAIEKTRQEEILKNPAFAHFQYLLSEIFKHAKYVLSEKEEKIINLKSQPASEMWNSSHDRMLSAITVPWKGKKLPLAEANNMVSQLKSGDRLKLFKNICAELKKVSAFSEAEMNAVMTDKKIEDELRGFKTPYEATVLGYENDPAVVEKLVKIVSENFPVSHKFFKIKAKLLKQKTLGYSDRSAKVGDITGDFSFEKSKKTFIDVLNTFDTKYTKIFESYIENGQIDVYPKKGKMGGAYCWGSHGNPTFVLLNHSSELRSYSTLAHEMGHAFHTELSKPLGPIYSGYSTSLAETASTFFESLAFEAIIESLPEKQKTIALHNKINEDISTIFRQIACFNFENELHATLRGKGFVSKEEMADMHNKHMKAYLGPVFKMEHDDGYFFVQWSHIRRFFYVYSYAYGLLVSKALLKKYREDKSFAKSIEKFLSSGGKDTPENILKDIGVDIISGELFREGIEEIKRDILSLEKLVRK